MDLWEDTTYRTACLTLSSLPRFPILLSLHLATFISIIVYLFARKFTQITD